MTTIRAELLQAVSHLAPEMRELALSIGRTPELGFQEFTAAASLSAFLERHGLPVERGIGNMPTAFRSSFQSTLPGSPAIPHKSEHDSSAPPTIALLAEYDALPGLGHACGHNLSGVASAAAAVALYSLRQYFSGTVQLLGTPSEEGVVPGAGGKIHLLKHGFFDGVDAAMMAHMAGESALHTNFIARASLEMEFHGHAAHAAAAPELGINAMDAAVCTVNAINALRQHSPAGSRIHGYIAEAGTMINTIPDYARLAYGVRTKTLKELSALTDRVLDCGRGAALSTGCGFAEREVSAPYAQILFNKPLLRTFGRALNEIGIFFREESPFTASSDMGNVSLRVPSIHPMVGLGDAKLTLHSREFAQAACSDRGLEAMINAAKALALSAWDMLTDAELRAAVHADFVAETAEPVGEEDIFRGE